jgi:hypothetical protein
MGASRLGRASRFALALPAALAVLAVLGPVADASPSPLVITAQVGYSNTVKLGVWMPVDVDVANSGPAFDGTLQIELNATSFAKGGLPGAGTVVYQAALSLAPGATKHFRTYVLQEQSGPITVQAVQGGRVAASSEASPGNTLSSLVGVISDQPSTLNALAGAAPAGWTPGIVHLSASDVPDSAVVLSAFDLIAIDDFSTDTLTAAQRTALEDYVLHGGSLLIGTGGSWHKTLAGLPAEIVPLKAGSSTVLAHSATLQGVAGMEIATGAIAGGARPWLSEGGHPLIVEMPAGSGLVMLAAFDWNQDAVAGWSGTPALLRQVLVRTALGSQASSTNTFNAAGPFVGSISSRGGSVAQALGNLPALDLPSFWLIGALVLVYVLLVGPVNYFVLRALNRRALAWVTVPAIALVASAGAYGSSVATKGQSVQANEVSIVHVEPGSARVYQELYTGIIAPTRGDYRVDISGAKAQIAPIDNYSGIVGNSPSTMRVDGATNGITLTGMTAFTLRGFAAERYTDGPSLEVLVRLSGGKLTGTVKNTSTISFTDGIVLAGNAFQRFGALEPGATATFGFAPAVGNPFIGPPAYVNAYPNLLYGGYTFGGPAGSTPSGAEREAEAKTAILSLLSGTSWSGAPTVVAWTKEPFEDVSVEGGRPRVYAESAVTEQLPAFQISTGALPAGITAGRLVDIDGSVVQQGGPPGVTMLNSGSITYDFAPALAAGTHLTSAAISSANQFAAKGAPVPASAGVNPARAEVWDWSESAWTEVNFQQPGTTSIPAAAVNPATGEVELKLSSDSAFSSGWLSLTGEVQ